MMIKPIGLGSSKQKKELFSEMRRAVVGASGDRNEELELRQVKFYMAIRH